MVFQVIKKNKAIRIPLKLLARDFGIGAAIAVATTVATGLPWGQGRGKEEGGGKNPKESPTSLSCKSPTSCSSSDREGFFASVIQF